MSQRRALPAITHLQFAVLGQLLREELPGRQLRRGLARLGERRSAPAFYQMMARLEEAGLVSGRYDQRVLDGQLIKERHYRVTASGVSAWERTRDFYAAQIAAHHPGREGA
jgi:DNA-binding PadR family transcriptional regulator